jgi:hypothetical protein
MRAQKPVRRSAPAVLTLALLVLAAPNCRADLILSFNPGSPTILGNNGTLAYNASTGNFDAVLTPLTYNAAFVLPRGFATFAASPAAQLTIDLTVDKNGNFVSNGTGLSLTGSVTINGQTFASSPGNPLLTGPITDFGSQAPAGPAPFNFEGVFSITGGVLTTTKGTVNGGFQIGTPGGFILNAENTTSGILGDFQASFSSSSVKINPLGSLVPEPGSMVQMITGLFLLAGWSLRRVVKTRSTKVMVDYAD